MKVWLVWRENGNQEEYEVLKIFRGEKKANEYIDKMVASKQYKESYLSIEEREVE